MTKLTAPLKWHGGKNYLAKRIVALFPKHIHYVEPFFGGGAVLLARNPEGVSEVVNDLNGSLTNFWKVLQDESAFTEFSRRVQAVPFSEYEYNQYADLSTLNPEECDVTCALAFFVRCRQSLAGRMDSFAPLSRNRTRSNMNEQASAWINAVDGLPAVHDRLKRVVILNRSALDVIRQQDGPETLVYADPPYVAGTRSSPDVYDHEMSLEDHRSLLNVLKNMKGKFILSGYDNVVYAEAARECGWKTVDFLLPNNSAGGKTKKTMTERLWMNFTPAEVSP